MEVYPHTLNKFDNRETPVRPRSIILLSLFCSWQVCVMVDDDSKSRILLRHKKHNKEQSIANKDKKSNDFGRI